MLFIVNKRIGPAIIFIIIFMAFYSCSEKIPAPAGKLSVKYDGLLVEFTIEATGTETYEWDFGDGSEVSTEQNPKHVFNEFGKDYTVTVKINGPGGETLITQIITIRPMMKMEMLTGGKHDPNGRRWKINPGANIYIAQANIDLSVTQSLPPGYLDELGFVNACKDEYIFKYNGDYSIIPCGQGVMAGLTYCKAKNIPNTPPGQEAVARGLTQTNTFAPPAGLKFAYNESRDLSIDVSDGSTSINLKLPDVSTLSFSKGGFLILNNWISDCVITDLDETSMKVATFTSGIPEDSPYAGKTNGVMIFTLELVK